MTPTGQDTDEELDGLLDRLVSLAEDPSLLARPSRRCAVASSDFRRLGPPDRGDELSISDEHGVWRTRPGTPATSGGFFPVAPRSLDETNIRESDVETIILRYLRLRGSTKGARDRAANRPAIRRRREIPSGAQSAATAWPTKVPAI